jgi:hypothetical protein
MNVDLVKEPLISAGALARPFGVTANTVHSIVEHLGIKPTRFPNGRIYLSWEQALRINGEMVKRSR